MSVEIEKCNKSIQSLIEHLTFWKMKHFPPGFYIPNSMTKKSLHPSLLLEVEPFMVLKDRQYLLEHAKDKNLSWFGFVHICSIRLTLSLFVIWGLVSVVLSWFIATSNRGYFWQEVVNGTGVGVSFWSFGLVHCLLAFTTSVSLLVHWFAELNSQSERYLSVMSQLLAWFIFRLSCKTGQNLTQVLPNQNWNNVRLRWIDE